MPYGQVSNYLSVSKNVHEFLDHIFRSQLKFNAMKRKSQLYKRIIFLEKLISNHYDVLVHRCECKFLHNSVKCILEAFKWRLLQCPNFIYNRLRERLHHGHRPNCQLQTCIIILTSCLSVRGPQCCHIRLLPNRQKRRTSKYNLLCI